MTTLHIGAAACMALMLSSAAMAQAVDPQAEVPAAEVSCAEILATPSLSAEEIAGINETSVVAVLNCQEADAASDEEGDLDALRSAVAANPSLSTTFNAQGVAPEQVVAVRRGLDGGFAFYVIGAYR